MKKIIQILLILILSSIFFLIIIFVFNPINLRTKLIGKVINSYLSSNLENYTPLNQDSTLDTNNTTDHPLLNSDQEEMLTDFGVDINQLPTEITPTMEDCFIQALGESRALELVNGATPSTMEIIKARSCLGK